MSPNEKAPFARGATPRWAVAGLFLLNGFVVGSWAPQIPAFKIRLALNYLETGVLILLFGLGAAVAMPLVGLLMGRHGSRTVVLCIAPLVAFGLLPVALANTFLLAACAIFIFGGLIGGMDVAMNTNAVAVERHLGRAIMSSSHAFWSLGGAAGAVFGGWLIGYYNHIWHAIGVTFVALLIYAATARYVLLDPPHPRATSQRRRLPKQPTIYLLGFLALFSMVPEGAVLDWAAIYLQTKLAATSTTAGLAFGLFSSAMMLMRFLGDSIRNRFGAVNTLRASSLVAALGLVAVALSPDPWLTNLAFAITGLGIANTVPIMFSAGGNQPGMSPATGMSIVTTIGYAGILLAPGVIGFIVEHVGFPTIFASLAALLTCVCLMARLASAADIIREKAASEASHSATLQTFE